MFNVPKVYADDLCVLKGTTDAILGRWQEDDVEVDDDTMEAIGKLNTAINAAYFSKEKTE
jgi:hypothetical protein